MTTTTTPPKSLREVAAEIIRLYHSEAPIRENLDLIQRHGLAMAQAIVDIDEDARAGLVGGFRLRVTARLDAPISD